MVSTEHYNCKASVLSSLTCHKKCVMCITGWMLLRLKQRIKIPEWAFYKVVGRHLWKPDENKNSSVLNTCSSTLHIHCTFEWFWYQSNKLTIAHLPHFQKDLSELCSNFHQRMKMTWCWYNSLCIKIVRLELFCFPGTTEE